MYNRNPIQNSEDAIDRAVDLIIWELKRLEVDPINSLRLTGKFRELGRVWNQMKIIEQEKNPLEG